MSYGRSTRRSGSRGAVAPAAETAAGQESAPPHEEALVDPFGVDEAPPERAVVDVPPAVEANTERDTEERDARIEEIERAMANFGRQREHHGGGQGYGRRGRKR